MVFEMAFRVRKGPGRFEKRAPGWLIVFLKFALIDSLAGFARLLPSKLLQDGYVFCGSFLRLHCFDLSRHWLVYTFPTENYIH